MDNIYYVVHYTVNGEKHQTEVYDLKDVRDLEDAFWRWIRASSIHEPDLQEMAIVDLEKKVLDQPAWKKELETYG